LKFLLLQTAWLQSPVALYLPMKDGHLIEGLKPIENFIIDGGNNWELIYSFPNEYDQILSVSMTDHLNGWLSLTDNYYSHRSFYKTYDGGYSWQNMDDNIIDIEDVNSYHFIDEDIEFISTFVSTDTIPNLYKTFDGGYSWDSIEVPQMYIYPNLPVNYRITTYYFLNDSIGWAGCQYEATVGNVLYTSDGGENWIAMDNPNYEVSSVVSLDFVSEQNGILLCFGCIAPFVLLTTDNCSTYTTLYIPGYAYALSFQNDSSIWVAEGSGGIYRSIDLGETFNLECNSDSYIQKISFFNNIGYFLGDNNTLLKFTDSSNIENNTIRKKDISLCTFPNPFNPSTTISFSIFEDCKVELSVFNVKGQCVNTIVNGKMTKGEHFTTWNGTDKSGKSMSSGVYFYKMNINGRTEVIKKCLLLK